MTTKTLIDIPEGKFYYIPDYSELILMGSGHIVKTNVTQLTLKVIRHGGKFTFYGIGKNKKLRTIDMDNLAYRNLYIYTTLKEARRTAIISLQKIRKTYLEKVKSIDKILK